MTLAYKPVTIAKDAHKERLKVLKDKGTDKLSKEEVNELLNILMEKAIA